MFVTNLTNSPLGVDGIIILKPRESMRYIEETPDLTGRVDRLKLANLVEVSYEEGLTKDGVVDAEEVVKVEAPAKPKRGAKVDAVQPEQPATAE